MLREVGFAANHFIEMAILQELRVLYPDQPQVVLQMRRDLLTSSKFCGPAVHQAFQQAVQCAVDALHVAFGPVGEQLRQPTRTVPPSKEVKMTLRFLRPGDQFFITINHPSAAQCTQIVPPLYTPIRPSTTFNDFEVVKVSVWGFDGTDAHGTRCRYLLRSIGYLW